jgi:hypothetical protein
MPHAIPRRGALSSLTLPSLLLLQLLPPLTLPLLLCLFLLSS